MLLLYIVFSIITAYVFIESPILGFFFYVFLMYSVYINLKKFVFMLTFTSVCLLSIYFVSQLDKTIQTDNLYYFVIDDYKYYKDQTHYIVHSDKGKYELYVTEDDLLPISTRCYGDIEINEIVEERNFIKRDAFENLHINQLAGRIYLDNFHGLSCSKHQPNLSQKINQIRSIYINKILNITEHDYKFDMLTLSIGNKSYIEADFFDALQKLGIYHLYVISGTHVAFLSGVVIFILRCFKLSRVTIKLILIAVLLCFFFLNFFSPSVLRATFMGIMLLVTSLFKRKPYLTIISLSALVQIVFNPWVMYHAGFQLSYMTTLFIVLCRPILAQYKNFTQLILITIICELSTIVIVLLQFNEISLSGLILNIFFVPLFSFLVFPSVIIFNVLSFVYFPEFLNELYHNFYTYLKYLIDQIAQAFKHRIPIKNLHDVSTILLIAISYKLILHCLSKEVFKVGIATVLIIIILYFNALNYKDNFTLTMVDVSQGDAFILRDHRENKTVLIDTGGRFSDQENAIPLSEKNILPYLKEAGLGKIDLLIISHLDIDHSGEAGHILEKLEVSNILINSEDEKFGEWVSGLSEEKKEKIIDSRNIKEFSIGNIKFQQLLTDTELLDSNNQSIVLKVFMDQYSVLFTGDISVDREESLLKEDFNLQSDILKVSHHGSDTSTSQEFLSRVSPKISLISAGVNNRYKHPHQEVVDNLSESIIYNTQESGMVEFKIKDDTICIRQKLRVDKACLEK